MVAGASLTIQLSGAIAHGLFDRLGPTGTSALRFAIASVVLVVAVRPTLRGRDRRTWLGIVAYGLSLAMLNVMFFQAIDRIPMGIAVTFAFVGPVLMALAASRRPADVAWVLVAAAGVAILGGIDPPGSVAGIVFGLLTGAAWVGVAYAGREVGARTRRVDGLALALPIASLVTVPLGVAHLGDLDARSLAIGALIAVVGLILPFTLELEGLRRLEPRVVAIVYSVDPAVAAIVGLLALGEGLTALQWAGMAAVMAASAGATATAGAGDV
jgi:inner membrane transporter RhtA